MNAKELFVLMRRVDMLTKFLMNIGFEGAYTFIMLQAVGTIEKSKYKSSEAKNMNEASIVTDLKKLEGRITDIENYLRHIGYPNSSLIVGDDGHVYVKTEVIK
jgi:hypothetical protein